MKGFALEIQNGPKAGRVIELPEGSFLLGRGREVDVGIVHETVSKVHAELVVGPDSVVVSDRASTNGTWVNGQRIARTTSLEHHDVLGLGEILLRCRLPGPVVGGSRQDFNFGDVNGPVQAGSGRQQTPGRDGVWTEVAGDQSVRHRVGDDIVAGRDQHIGDRFGDVNLDLDLGLNEPFEGKGLGVVIMWVGLLATVVGFAIFASAVFAFFGDVQAGFAGEDPFADGSVPFDTEVLGLPALPLGFGLAMCGGVLWALGRGRSMAARRRARRAPHVQRR